MEFLDEKRSEIRGRLKELKPAVDEYARLQAAAAALDAISGAAPAPLKSRSRRTRKPAIPASQPRPRDTAQAKRRGRPKGTGARSKEALALVTASPGITIPELAERMGIKQNYLYRVLPGLADEGLVTKDGRGWHPKVPT